MNDCERNSPSPARRQLQPGTPEAKFLAVTTTDNRFPLARSVSASNSQQVRIVLYILMTLMLAAQQAQSATQTYTSRAAFTAAGSNLQTITFDGYAPANSYKLYPSLTISGMTFSNTIGYEQLIVVDSVFWGWPRHNTGAYLINDDDRWAGFLQITPPPGTTAIGAEFSERYMAGDQFTAHVSIAAGGTNYDFHFPAQSSPGSTFFGFLSDQPIASLTYDTYENQLFDQIVDNVTFGTTTPPLPSLTIAFTAPSTLLLSWAAPADGWQLHAKPSMATTNWDGVTNVPLLVGGRMQVSVPVLPDRQFFRLIKP
jgi:hypothetical protein